MSYRIVSVGGPDCALDKIERLTTDRDELRRVLRELLSLYESPEDEIGGIERLVLNEVRKLLEAKA